MKKPQYTKYSVFSITFSELKSPAQILKKEFLEIANSMMILQMTDPAFNAWLSTVSLWISRVRPNGSWDYKVSSTYGPYNNPLYSYYGGTYHHFTAEYFGKLKYGYTGAYLFDLNTLHFGSSAVSEFNPADESDWPAIDEGYYLKTS